METDFYGIYNCVNDNYCTKKDVLQYILEINGIEKKVVSLPETYLDTITPRPSFNALNTSLINNCFDIHLPSWQERVNEYCGISLK